MKAAVIHKSLPGRKYTLCGLNKQNARHTMFVFSVTCKTCKRKLSAEGLAVMP